MTQYVSGISVAHEEYEDSPSERWDAEGFFAERRLKCAWGDRFLLMQELLGGVDAEGVSRLPDRYPGTQNARAVSCEVIPSGGLVSSGENLRRAKHSEADLKVTYRVPTWSLNDSGPRYSERILPMLQAIQTDAAGLVWASDDERVVRVSPPPVSVRYVYELTLHQVHQLPAGWEALVGRINNDNVLSRSLGLSFGAGQLLFEAPRFEREVSATGGTSWEVRFRMLFRMESTGEVDWNYFRRGTGWDQLKADGGDVVKPYEAVAFMPVLRFFDP